MIFLKRIYEPYNEDDGCRVLVDRLWPRGISKDEAKVDLWLKDIAPSNELRKWFGHKKERWEEFKMKYKQELEAKKLLKELIDLSKKHKRLTLLYGAKDEEHNQAIIIVEMLQD